MTSRRHIRLLVGLSMLAIAAQASADDAPFRFRAVSDPHAGTNQGTAVNGINLLGVVAGNYGDTNNVYHAMVSLPTYPTATYFTIDGPGSAPLTNAWGINLEGTTTGYYVDANGVYHAFVSQPPYTTVTAIDAPGACSSGAICANSGTEAFSINLEGTIAGYYVDTNGVAHGFVSHPPYTDFRVIDAPGACSAGPACANLGTAIQQNSLNDFGAITGSYFDANGIAHGFVSRPPYTVFVTVDVPGACSSGSKCHGAGTGATSINFEGQITGVEVDASGLAHHGFESDPPYTTFRTFDAPSACSQSVPICAGQGTTPQNIDWDGTIIGYFSDSNGVVHGFITRRPFTHVTTFDDPNACSSGPACSGAGTFPYASNGFGGIAGTAVDSAGTNHGFIAQPN
jgi:hypothetical protein